MAEAERVRPLPQLPPNPFWGQDTLPRSERKREEEINEQLRRLSRIDIEYGEIRNAYERSRERQGQFDVTLQRIEGFSLWQRLIKYRKRIRKLRAELTK